VETGQNHSILTANINSIALFLFLFTVMHAQYHFAQQWVVAAAGATKVKRRLRSRNLWELARCTQRPSYSRCRIVRSSNDVSRRDWFNSNDHLFVRGLISTLKKRPWEWARSRNQIAECAGALHLSGARWARREERKNASNLWCSVFACKARRIPRREWRDQ